MTFIQKDISEKLTEAVEYYENAREILLEAGLDRLAEKVSEDLEAVQSFAREDMDFDALGEEIRKFKSVVIRANNTEKDDYESVKDKVSLLRKGAGATLSQLRSVYFTDSLVNQVELMQQTYPGGTMLLDILLKFKEIYGMKKRDKNLVDYNDIEHYAIEILKNDLVSEEYKEKFKYIFIDEYQDSNYLQEAIIWRVKREDNLFMVGDIKQSIYRFRLAEPGIFKETYRNYQQDSENSCKIDLNENFRSKKDVIDGINHVFSNLMEDYDENAALYEGNPMDEDVHYPVTLHVVDSSATEEEIDEELQDMKNAELEALAASKVIKDSIGLPIFDHKKDIERKLEKKDIVILMRGVRNTADIFYKILSENDVPAYLDDNSGYFDTLEITTFLDLLRVIDNKQQDIPLLSVLRSPIFGFSIDDLIKIRLLDKSTSYFKALEKYASEGEEEHLRKGIGEFFEKLHAWKKESSYTPIHEFVWNLMTRTGYYAFVGAMPGGVQRQANLRAFVDKTLAFGSKGNNTIFGLLRYIEIIGDRQIETGQVSLLSENDDLVRIMTIHKSKGLEYPMVVVCGLGKRFVSDKMKKIGSIHKDLGFAMTFVDPQKHWYKKTLGESAILEMNSREAMEEEVRILYVAATRAMDKLVLMGTVKDGQKFREKMELGMSGKSTYLDLLAPCLAESDIRTTFHSRESLGAYLSLEEAEKKDILAELRAYAEDRDEELEEYVDQVLSYRYEHKKALKVRSKFSVSELNGKGKKNLTLEQPIFAAGKTVLTGAEKGTIIHTVMEHLDFREAYGRLLLSEEECRSYVSQFVSLLVDRDILTEEEASHVSSQKIAYFFKSEIGRRSAEATLLHKERAFNILTEYEGTEVMVQGIIDCYFQEGDDIVLLDYKTNYSTMGIEELYREQMALYGEALEKGIGRKHKEAYLYLFSEDREVKIQ